MLQEASRLFPEAHAAAEAACVRAAAPPVARVRRLGPIVMLEVGGCWCFHIYYSYIVGPIVMLEVGGCWCFLLGHERALAFSGGFSCVLVVSRNKKHQPVVMLAAGGRA